MASFLRRWAIFRSKALTAAFGVAILNETTTLDFPSETPEDGSPSPDSFDKTESQWNAGPVFGVQAELPGNGPLHAAVSWDSHVFLAGPNGGLFLAYGRKQTVSVSLGMKF